MLSSPPQSGHPEGEFWRNAQGLLWGNGSLRSFFPRLALHLSLPAVLRCSRLEGTLKSQPVSLFKWEKFGPSILHFTEGGFEEHIAVAIQSLNHARLFETPRLQHTRLPCSSPSPRVCSNSCPLRQWCHPTISSSAICFSSCPQSFPPSRSSPMSQLFASGDQSVGASASGSVLPMNIQGWLFFFFFKGWPGLISLQSKGLSRIYSITTVWKHQVFGAQFSLWSNSHIHTWLLEKP